LKPDELKNIRDGKSTCDSKRDALVRFVRKLAQSSGTVSDEDFAAIKAAGYSDAQLVEISLAFATTVFTNAPSARPAPSSRRSLSFRSCRRAGTSLRAASPR